MDEADSEWLSALRAVGVCRVLFHLDESGARRRLVELAADEEVRTRCVKFVFRDYDEWSMSGGDSFEDDEVPPRFWNEFRRLHSTSDWANGLFSVDGHQSETRVHGVRFNRLDLINHKRKLDDLPPLTELPPPPAPPPPQISRAPPPITPLRSYVSVPGVDMPRPNRGKEISLAELRGRQREAKSEPKAAGRATGRAPSRKGPVTPSEFREWHATLSADDQALGYRDLWPPAVKAFRPRKVVRKLAEDLVKDLKRGVGRRPRNAPAGH